MTDLARLADRAHEERDIAAGDDNDNDNDDDAMAVVPVTPPEDHDELISKVEQGLSLREKLVDVLLTWLKLGEGGDGLEGEGGPEGSSSSGVNTKPGAHLHRSLQKEAFSIIGSLRTLFPQVTMM